LVELVPSEGCEGEPFHAAVVWMRKVPQRPCVSKMALLGHGGDF
jgi:hypothetical protein